MEKESGHFLNDNAVLALIPKHSPSVVYLVALDCNWTGKILSDGEEYFDIWVAVSFHENKDRIFIHGARFSNWNLEYEMSFAGKSGNTGLYKLSLKNSNDFPNEFVIKLVRESGEHIYDNNDYRNYSIEHGKGRFATAVSFENRVLSFGKIIPIKVTDNV